MSGLRELRITNAELSDLPTGRYLSRLEDLQLYECKILKGGLPASLAAATQLRQLKLDRWVGDDLQAADVALLSRLPALAALTVNRRFIERLEGNFCLISIGVAKDVWNERVAQLQAACVAQGRAPPAIFRE